MDTDLPRGFETNEFVARCDHAQARMAQGGIDGLLVMTEPEVRYFSGFQTLFWQSPTRSWFLYIPAQGKPIAVIPEIGAALMRETWLDDIRSWSAPAPQDDGISLLADLLQPLSAKGGHLGVMMGHETHLRMPLADWERLRAALPGLKLRDVTDLVQGLRMVKSPAEIKKIAKICQIGSETFETVPEFAVPGQPLEDVFRTFRRRALALGADDAPYLVGGAAPGGYTNVISPPSQRPLQNGDILMLDTGLVWDGYYCDFDRNWAIGAPCDAAKRAYDVLWRATEAGMAAARPGAKCRDVFNAMHKVICELDDGGGDIGRLGHGLGMQLTEQPSLAPFDQTILQENMVLTLEPSLTYGDGQMMVQEENIVVQAGGPKVLTKRAPAELPIIS